ncbi:MAG: hypothetical protein M3198_16715 [Actinomycetota bacterium]|nr:hypothetical protein [Actinomycetota bacterium]
MDILSPDMAFLEASLPTESNPAKGGLRIARRLSLRGILAHRRLVALLIFGGLTVLFFHKAWVSPGDHWIGEPGDPPLFMWYLRWFPYAIAHGQNPLFTTHMNYPDGVNLMWNTSMPLAGLMLSPLTMTVGPLFTYNVLMTLALALSAWCAYLAIRHFVESDLGAIVGGLLYGFSPYMVAHARAHPNLPMAFIPPLLLIVLDEILVRQRRSDVAMGIVLGVLAASQVLLTEELLASQAIVFALGVVLLVALNPREVAGRVRYAARALSLALAVFVLLVAWPLGFQFLGPQRVTHGSLWSSEIFVSDLLSFVVPTELQQLSGAWSSDITRRFTDSCCVAEWNSYVGLPLIVLLVVAATTLWSKKLVRFVSLLAVAVAILSMGPHLHIGGKVTTIPLPLSVISELPVIGNLLAGRLMLYVYLLAGIILAAFIEHARRSSVSPALVGITLLVALAPLFPKVPFPSTKASAPAFFTSPELHEIAEGSVALVAPFARDTSTSAPMLWQALADMRYRMPSGYALGPDRSGRFVYLPLPTSLSETMEQIQLGAAPAKASGPARREWRRELRAKDVSTVIVGPMLHQQAMVNFFRSLLEQEPARTGGVYLWRGSQHLVAEGLAATSD